MRHKPFPTKDELILSTACPFCSCTSLSSLGTPVSHEGTPLQYERCDQCDLIFMNPRPNQNWYNHLYRAEFWEVKQEKKNSPGHIRRQVFKEAQWAEKIISILESNAFSGSDEHPAILEIGCAYGLIGKLVADHFAGRAYGVEPSDTARIFARDVTGIEIFGENIDQLIHSKEAGRFDLIVFSHVLENIIDPIAALKVAGRLLKKDGIILIDTPNSNVRRSWHIHHPYCFTKPALTSLLTKAGLKMKTHRIWSRPRYLLGPTYLTVVAQKSENQKLSYDSHWSMRINNLKESIQFTFFNQGPVAELNRRLARRVWEPSEASKKEINRVIAKHNSLSINRTQTDGLRAQSHETPAI